LEPQILKNKTQTILYFNFILCLFIIAWGAWVRLSGSGAGCGDHWPLCNGEVIPLTGNWKTYTEYIHRFSTGLFGLTVLAQIYFSHKEFIKGHPVVKGSYALLIMTLIESFIGAVLVKRGLVVDNTSAERALVVGLHLVNTMLLLSTMVHSHFFLGYRRGTDQKLPQLIWEKSEKKNLILGLLGLLLILMVGAFGAITALGNTLFPSADIASGVAADFDVNSPFLIQLRVYHPLLAIIMGGFWMALISLWKPEESKKNYLQNWCRSIYILLVIGLGFGLLNWILMAPIWGALIHLILADLIWMGCLGLMYRKFYV